MSSIASIASGLASSTPVSQAIGTAVLDTVEHLAQDQVNRLFGSFGVGQNVNGHA